MQWTAIINPAAGGKHSVAIRAALAERRDVRCVAPQGREAAIDAAREAFATGHGVIAVGGDGTFGLLSGIAAQCDGVLALVPNGTGNDMAHEFGLTPRDYRSAIALLDSGRIAEIDMGTITDANGTVTWFPSVASIGFDAAANARANEITRVPGSAKYLAAALSTLRSFKPLAFELEIDGRIETRWAWLVAVANASRYGGGMRIAPDAQLADGTLELVTVGPISRPQLLRQLPRVFRGTHVDHPSITTRHVRTIRVAPRCDTPLECYASGDVAGPTPVEIAVAPNALKVVVSASHPLAGDPIPGD